MNELPGGLWIDGQRRQAFRFAPVTAHLELTLSESLSDYPSHPARVTRVLAEALESLGGEPADCNRVRALCVGDRQFLMRQLAGLLDPGPRWLSAYCTGCGEPFEICYEHAALPVKTAGEGFPRTRAKTSLGPLWVRPPLGADQELLAAVDDDDEALELLLARLLQVPDIAPQPSPADLTDDDRQHIEQAVEDLSPEVATHSQSDCPHCGAPNQVEISPYACLERPPRDLYQEIHTLAMHYHWSEDAILALPRARRQTYLGLIDRSRGLHGAEELIRQTG